MNRALKHMAAGLTALFCAAAAMPTQSHADSIAYNPDPTTAAGARQQIVYLRDQLAALPARFAGAAQALQTEMPAQAEGLKPDQKTCFALSDSIRFSFDYGPGPIHTPMMHMMEVPARDSNSSTTGGHTLVPDLPAQYYPTLLSFLRGERNVLGDTAYRDVDLPPTLIGCAATPEALRPALQQANFALYLALRARVTARIETDYTHLRGIIYRQTQDPVLTSPAP